MQLDPYIYTLKCLGDIPKGLEQFKGIDKTKHEPTVFWGNLNEPSNKAVTIESGFFWEAFHIDTKGLYQNSSLCTPQAINEIEDFCADVPAKEILERVYTKNGHESKYSQGQDPEWESTDIEWNGVVLACQNPTDRSIRSVANPEDYYKFVYDACKFYGSDLFIKLHPWNNGDVRARIEKYAKEFGCKVGKINHRVIENCQFCLVFNSTFTIDCLIRDIPVVQYAPGYFYQMPCVYYSRGTFPNIVYTDKIFGQRLCDFLMWRYCFDYTMPSDKWIDMLTKVLESNEMFPLPKEYSYGFNRA